MRKNQTKKAGFLLYLLLAIPLIFFSCRKNESAKQYEVSILQAKDNSIQKVALENTSILSCGSDLNLSELKTKSIERYNRYMKMENALKEQVRSKKARSVQRTLNQESIVYIPVVVHVLHNGEAIGVGNNISDDQVLSQIYVLNEDFRRNNGDKANTPSAFAGIAADTKVEFYLACKDPDGNPTNGIHRVSTSVTIFTKQLALDGSTDEVATKIKFSSQGGADAWSTDKYLNIWVCNLGGGLGGYAQFPADYYLKPSTDGVVVFNQCFGRGSGFNLLSGYDKGRIATHEVGHWLNLYHIWGDDGTACTGSDQCSDTPNQAGHSRQSFGVCASFPLITCSNGPNGNMFMNYMDYGYDDCQNLFTNGQKDRMWATFDPGQPRNSFAEMDPPVTEGALIINSDIVDGIVDGWACAWYDYEVWIPFDNVVATWGIANGSIVHSYSDTRKRIRFNQDFVDQGGGSIWVTVVSPCGDEYFYELAVARRTDCDRPDPLRQVSFINKERSNNRVKHVSNKLTGIKDQLSFSQNILWGIASR